MLVQQIQSHCGDTSSANELGLTVVGETEAADFVLSSKKAERNREKSSCETRKYKTGSAYQVSSCSSIVSLQEHQVKKKKEETLGGALFQAERSTRDPTTVANKNVVLSQLL